MFSHSPLLTVCFCVGITCLFGCGSEDMIDRDSQAESAVDYFATDAEALSKAKKEARKLVGESGEEHRAAWDQASDKWSDHVLGKLKTLRTTYELAADIEDFCPAYEQATDFQKDTCWLRILSAMARYESHFKPKATYKEHTGKTSVGLLMMNPNHCPAATSEEALKDPIKNIDCAMERMRLLISLGKNVSGPTENRGAAAYWSVLRPHYTFRTLRLGRKPLIQEFTKTYMAFAG